jgi:hypothetical protein
MSSDPETTRPRKHQGTVLLVLTSALCLISAPLAKIGVGLSAMGADGGLTSGAITVFVLMQIWLASCVVAPLVGWIVWARGLRGAWMICLPTLVADVAVLGAFLPDVSTS